MECALYDGLYGAAPTKRGTFYRDSGILKGRDFESLGE